MRTIGNILFIGMLVMNTVSQLPAEEKSPAILLQEALYQEETEGNLDKAMELYGQVLQQAADVERVAARAAYQLGMCHLKKDNPTEAADWFRKVVNDYPKQAAIVKKAQAELRKIAPQKAGNGLHKLEQAISVKISTSPDGDRLTVQYAAMEIAKAAGIPYQWQKSQDLAGSKARRYIEPFAAENKSAADALTELLTPVGLTYGVDQNGLFLSTPGNLRANQIIFTDSFEEGGESPIAWEKGQVVEGVAYVWDKNTGIDGQASLCLKKAVDKYFPVAQWTRTIEHTGTAEALTVSAQVRAQKAHKAVIDALFLDDEGEWIKHEWISYIGAKEAGDPPANHNWKEYAGTVGIPENTKTIVIGLQMYGPGAVWFDEVKAAYTTTTAALPKNKPDKLKSEDLTAEGWKLWQQRKLAEAEAKFEEAIKADPQSEGAYQGLGWAQLNQGKKQNAEVSFKKCVKLNPENSAALNGLGWIAYGNDDKQTAIKWWKKAVEAQPGATAALSGLTQAYTELGQYKEAVKYYEMWLKVEPNSQEAKDGLAAARNKMS